MAEIYSRAAELMEAELGDELVGLDVEAGNCFGFNDVATVIWRELEQPKSFDAIHAKLTDQYDVDPGECARDLSELLDDLIAKGLVTRA